MNTRLLSVLTRNLRCNGLLNNYGKIKLDKGEKSVEFSRCNLCTEVTVAENVSQPLESARVPERENVRIHEVSGVRGNLHDYADRSPILQNLIDLGVEIYKFQGDKALCKYLMQLDFDDIKPYLEFLHNNGVPVDRFGEYITRNPYIFQCDLEDLQIRINYLESKKFTKKMISHIITQNPKWLSYEVVYIDSRLGSVQTTLELGGDEMRSLVYNFPGIVSLKSHLLRLNMFTFKEEFGTSMEECKKIILKEPRLLKTDNQSLINTLHFLTYKMGVPMHLIIEQPKILSCRAHILRIRHQFLHRLGRAQYNPKLPGYVPLTDLVAFNDEEFCNKIAMTSLDNFYKFQKTL